MDGIHDLGGRQGFGPVDVHEPEVPFHEAWEGRMLGIVRSFTRPPGVWGIDRFRHVRELIGPADYLSRGYYDQWLQTYAAMLIDAGAATVREVASGRSEKPVPGLPPPQRADEVVSAKRFVLRYDRESNAAPVFSVGDRVRTRSMGSVGHTRLPQYARGRVGTIAAFRGIHPLPDLNMQDDGPAEPLYTAWFAAADLWPEAAGSKDRVYVDVWESYLERA